MKGRYYEKTMIIQAFSFLSVFLISSMVFTGEFKVLPGAKIHEEATKKARQIDPDSNSTIYTTKDSFEGVDDYYANLEEKVDFPMQFFKKLPSGQKLKMSFYVFDGAASSDKSMLWIKIQYPSIMDMQLRKVIEVTAICFYDKRQPY